MAKETIVTIYTDDTVEVVTTSTKWSNRMDQLVADGHAEEIETDMTGKAYRMGADLLKMPFYRKPREWTEEQKQAARERLAKAREQAKAKSTRKTTRRTTTTKK
jgi:hypothetical protein